MTKISHANALERHIECGRYGVCILFIFDKLRSVLDPKYLVDLSPSCTGSILEPLVSRVLPESVHESLQVRQLLFLHKGLLFRVVEVYPAECILLVAAQK